MNKDQSDKPLELNAANDSHAEDDSVDGSRTITVPEAAIGLALYSANSALNSINSAVRLSGKLGRLIFSPAKRVSQSAPLKPVTKQFEKLVAKGETELNEWINTGLSPDLPVTQLAKNSIDPIVDAVVGYLSTNPAVEKLIKEQIGQLAEQSNELPQINVLVRVLADNYITYLNENPEQVKALIYSQGDEYIDHLSEDPKKVQVLVQGQSVSMIGQIADEIRERLVTGDSALESLARALFRKPPRAELPEPPDEVQVRATQSRHPDDFPRLREMQNGNK